MRKIYQSNINHQFKFYLELRTKKNTGKLYPNPQGAIPIERGHALWSHYWVSHLRYSARRDQWEEFVLFTAIISASWIVSIVEYKWSSSKTQPSSDLVTLYSSLTSQCCWKMPNIWKKFFCPLKEMILMNSRTFLGKKKSQNDQMWCQDVFKLESRHIFKKKEPTC